MKELVGGGNAREDLQGTWGVTVSGNPYFDE